MAGNRISVIIDVAVDKANASLKSFKSTIDDADGAAGKFKAGAGAAFTSLQQNAGNLALAGGTALVAFGVKAVGAFQETALAAGEMRDALGLTSEEASQYIEVADDLGIGSDVLAKSIGRMNVAAAKTPGAFEAIGAAIAKNADGTTDVNKTFQNTVDALSRIPDATDRAAAAAKIFGKGWQSMAELIAMGGEGIQEALEAVEGGKVIDDAEVEKARKFRDTLDELKGVGEQAAIVLGGKVVDSLLEIKDVVEDAEAVFGPLIDAAGELAAKTGGGDSDSLVGSFMRAVDPIAQGKHLLEGYSDALEEVTGSSGDTTEATDELTTSASALQQAAIDAALGEKRLADETAEAEEATDAHADAVQAHNDGLQEQYDKLHNVTDAFRELRGELSHEEGFINIRDSMREVQVAGREAWDAAASGAIDAGEKADAYRLKQIDLTNEVIDYAEEVGNIPPEKVSEILALIDQGDLAQAEEYLRVLTRNRQVYVGVWGPGAGNAPRISQGGGGATMHDGGIVGGQSFAGLANDEVPAILQKGEAVLTEGQQAALGGGMTSAGTAINLTVNAGIGTDGNQVGRQIVDVLNAYYRNGGQPPR